LSDHASPESSKATIHGRGWAVVVPTAVVCALITALTNLVMRPTAEAHASTPSPSEVAAMRDDIRELRADVKQILTRMGALEDAQRNAELFERSRPPSPAR
jgi:hypothetical protein